MIRLMGQWLSILTSLMTSAAMAFSSWCWLKGHCWQDIAQFPALQHLDEGDEPKAVAQVAAQVLDAQACLLELVVHPVAEGVRLDLHPDLLVAFDRHGRGRVTKRTARHQTTVRYLLAIHYFAQSTIGN